MHKKHQVLHCNGKTREAGQLQRLADHLGPAHGGLIFWFFNDMGDENEAPILLIFPLWVLEYMEVGNFKKSALS